MVAKAQAATRADVEISATSVHEDRGIRQISAIERIEIFECAAALLEEHKDEMARVMQIEAGKTFRDATSEVDATANRLKMTMEETRRIYDEYVPGDWATDTLGKMALIIMEPVGVVACISSFNYPLYIASSKVIPVLLAGNSVVLKPASADPISAILLTKILVGSGIPVGSLSLITGHGDAVGDSLVTQEKVNMISFTGSIPRGKDDLPDGGDEGPPSGAWGKGLCYGPGGHRPGPGGGPVRSRVLEVLGSEL